MANPQGIPVIGGLLNKIIGSRNDRFVRRYTSRTEAINRLEPGIRQLTDAELRAKFLEFRDRHDAGMKTDELLIESFAVAREAMDRAVGIRNIFNPEAGFDPDQLSAEDRAIYDQVKAEAEALPDLLPRTLLPKSGPPPEGVPDEGDEFLGCTEPVPGWQRVEIPIRMYEAVRELYPESRPPFRARPFDVQLIGAMVLSGGKIAEMKTGEGKTIVAPLATYLACIERQQVHVVTVNDYLVQRDRDWTFPFFRALGLTIGAIHPQHQQPEELKQWMYRCNVVYGTTSEFGFDYLRDNMKRSIEQQVQRKRQFAIVDEVDSILIDEARTPLIISGPAHDDQPRYDMSDRLARYLVEKQKPWQEREDQVEQCKQKIKGLEGDIRQIRDKSQVPEMQKQLDAAKSELPHLEAERDAHTQYYEVQMDRKSCHLTHDGISEAQREAGVGSFYVDENMDVPHLLEQALRAHAVYQLDRDYVVMDIDDRASGRREPTIVIVDTFTGRPMIGRQWSDGLHQAVEAKEGVPIKQETQTIATVTIQNFYKMYKRLSGMTGTADTEAQEFRDIYKLDVVTIPTNKPVIRADYDDLMFLRAKDKWEAIVDEIKAFHDVGRPILVGTTSVERSEMLAQMLMRKHQIKHNVLNAKQHEREANIIEDAGSLGAVMIATNMAGRGTDIKLEPITREILLDHWLRRSIASRGLTVDSTDEELRENVYRKIAPSVLSMPKREAESMDFAELELKLLRHWATSNTWAPSGKIDTMDAETLRNELDGSGRSLLHRLRWFDTIEEMGGLHVIGTERHESRRIDNQLRGRSGRQGDKGSTRFFV
ncbi:Protein translocase subunit SecA, partial [hydrothermal vent metagenome]